MDAHRPTLQEKSQSEPELTPRLQAAREEAVALALQARRALPAPASLWLSAHLTRQRPAVAPCPACLSRTSPLLRT